MILAVRPEVDGGRYPIKRVLGDSLVVEADIVSDGHDVLRAVVLDRPPGADAWRETALVPLPNDVWRAEIALAGLGRHAYTVLAWVDAFATWHRGLARKIAAGVAVAVELLDGALLVEAVLGRPDLPAADRALLCAAAADLRAARVPDDAFVAVMRAHAQRPPVERYDRDLAVLVERPLAACSAWYELFPRSTGADGAHGTFRTAEAMLAYVAELGFDVVYLPPIHPIGTAFRKGPENAPEAGPGDVGSPWAIGAPEGGHTSVHPALGTLADFDRFVAAARALRLEVALDLAFQASPDHPWVTEHPTWFKARADGTIQYAENPPKKYQDVYPFDFDSADASALWAALRDVIVFWCERGVRAFRVDNPHTKPIRFWEWCLAQVRARFPDVIFLAEAFTRPKLMYALAKVGFSQGYTYFTWRTASADLAAYALEVTRSPVAEYFRPNFWPTTPDIFPAHLVHGGRAAFVLRVILAGTLAASYGIYGPSYELGERVPRPGAEELAQNEKYQLRAWDLAAPGSLRHVIARLNEIRRAHPALQRNDTLQVHASDNDLVLCYSKRSADGADTVLCVVNLDPHHVHRAWLTLDLAALGLPPDETYQVHDLLGDARFHWRGARAFVELAPEVSPAHVFEIQRFARRENQFEYFL